MFRALWKVIADRVGRSDGHRRRHRPLRLGIETLEARRLLSIVWSHRGCGDYSDYYRTIAHELGHAVGIDAGPAMGRSIRSAGRDQLDPADLYRFYNPSGQFRVRATFTAFDGMHFYEGPPDPNWPPQPTHQHDLLNAGRTVNPSY